MGLCFVLLTYVDMFTKQTCLNLGAFVRLILGLYLTKASYPFYLRHGSCYAPDTLNKTRCQENAVDGPMLLELSEVRFSLFARTVMKSASLRCNLI